MLKIKNTIEAITESPVAAEALPISTDAGMKPVIETGIIQVIMWAKGLEKILVGYCPKKDMESNIS